MRPEEFRHLTEVSDLVYGLLDHILASAGYDLQQYGGTENLNPAYDLWQTVATITVRLTSARETEVHSYEQANTAADSRFAVVTSGLAPIFKND